MVLHLSLFSSQAFCLNTYSIFPVCKLCLYERYPYVGAVGFSLFGFFFHKNASALLFTRSLLILLFSKFRFIRISCHD
ncbi:MAG: disulfide bond formation protein B [Holosporaceae bacterium]|nr:MAG: disulfide bond formation protein B [Holosporaceae bacterium]